MRRGSTGGSHYERRFQPLPGDDPTKAKGVSGMLSFDGATVIVTRNRWPDKGEVRFSVRDIRAVEYKHPPSKNRGGYVAFLVPGASDRPQTGTYWTKTGKDERHRYRVDFTLAQAEVMRRICDAIGRARPEAAPAAAPAGWYPAEEGRLRWWDGRQWTHHYAPTAAHS